MRFRCGSSTNTIATILALTAITALVGSAGLAATHAVKKADSPVVAKCKADLAKRLKTVPAAVTLAENKPTTWPDAALGMPEPGKMYAQVLTPGSRVILELQGTRYLYVTSAKGFKYAGPVDIWKSSMLYTKPIKNEPNLNRDLYQCSLLGTNCAKVASGVSDVYPQADGAILYTSRTSRSGFDLMYLKPGQKKPVMLYPAFAFISAALNAKQDQWAAVMKPTLGRDWVLIHGPVDGFIKPLLIPVPEDVLPQQVAWSDEKVMMVAKAKAGTDAERTVAFEITPDSEKPEWKPIQVHEFPLFPDYMLNKSESLDIRQLTEDGKQIVEVSKLWFTGDRNVLARIEGVTMRGQTLLPYGFAFIWGEKNDAPVAYTVDISTGEVIRAASVGNDVKPFLWPPKTSPLGTTKP